MEIPFLTLFSRCSPSLEAVEANLLRQLAGDSNPGEVVARLHRQLGGCPMILLVISRPNVLFQGSSTLTILLTEEDGTVTAQISSVRNPGNFVYMVNKGYLRRVEEILREMGFAGENDPTEPPEEKSGVLSAVKKFWNTDET